VDATAATSNVVCPLNYNKDFSTDWTTGVQAVNLGSNPTNVSFTLVKAGLDPASNSVTLSGGDFDNLGVGEGVSAILAQQPSAFSNFEGAVFVTSTGGEPIIAVSSNTNYTALGAAALYNCINY
jgi:hypothetical protein